MSFPGPISAAERATGPLGVRRSYFGWNDGDDEDRVIRADIAAGRLSWVSFRPPRGAGDWLAMSAGVFDDALRSRARRYAAHPAPVVVTFNHEPSKHDGSGTDFAAAWVRAHTVMADETGLENVSFVPILGDWAFNPRNPDASAHEFLPPSLLERLPFLGVDCYQNDSGEGFEVRLGRILAWLEENGVANPMIGLGETGCTDAFGSPNAVQWWRSSWAWVEANTDKIGIVSYFNSNRNSKHGVHWPLDESPAKLATFRASLRSSASCRLQPQTTTVAIDQCQLEER
jgi:hypothetical protein